MIRTTVNEIVNTIGGTVICGSGETSFSQVYQDSRLIECEGIFFAIRGDLFDGHDFVESAVEKGAVAVVVEKDFVRNRGISFLDSLGDRATVIEVDNTVKALQLMAKDYVEKIRPVVVGVTGSTGKTTTRDMIYSICSEKFKTIKNPKNYNSNVGVPLTVFQLEEDTRVAVIEMGTDHRGEIFEIADIVRPNVAVITNIGLSHMEHFKTQKEIFLEKMDITAFMREGDCLITLDDGKFFPDDLKSYSSAYRSNLILTALIGDKNRDNFKLESISETDYGIEVIMGFRDKGGIKQEKFSIPLKGKHNGENAALAIAVAEMLGIDRDLIKSGLAKVEITGNRLEMTRSKDILIIDDSYNASPDSVKAAVDVLHSYRNNRRIAVLGDMYELGKETEKFHREVGEYTRERVDKLFSVGELGKFIDEDNNFQSIKKLSEFLKRELKAGDVVLFKASRGMSLDILVKDIKEWLGE